MKNYTVTLTRGYRVSITAENKQNAMQLAEFYIGSGIDESDEAERAKHNFAIESSEMTFNEAIDAIEGND